MLRAVHRSTATCLAACVVALLWGFEWPGRLGHLEREMQTADPAQRRAVVRQLMHSQADGVHPLVLRALEDDDLDVRLEAAEAVAALVIREAVPVLVDWLDEDEPRLRASAASSLGALRDLRVLPALVRTLGDGRAEVRAAAVRGLAALGSTDAVEPLLQHLGEPDSSVRAQIIRTLGALGDARAVPALMGQPEDDQPELVIATLRALGRLADPQALPSLLAGLSHDRQDVRIAACQALGELGSGQAFDGLAEVVRGPDPLTARAALAALSHLPWDDARPENLAVALLGDAALDGAARALLLTRARRQAAGGAAGKVAGSVTALVAALAAEPEPATAERLAPALVELSRVTAIDGALPHLLAALPHSDAPVLLQAVASSRQPDALVPLLEQLERRPADQLTPVLAALSVLMARIPADGRAADPLVDALGKASGEARARVVSLLGLTGAERVLDTLRPLLGHTDLALRMAAITAVGQLGDSEAAGALLELVAAPRAQPELRHAAALALGQCATPSEVLGLLKALVGDRPADRHAMLRALSRALPRLADQERLPPKLATTLIARLSSLLSHPDDGLAAAVFDVLDAWHPPEALHPLAALLRHPSPRRRARAAQAMANFPAADSRPVLRHVLRASSTRSVVAAVTALGEVGDARDLPALLGLMDREHWPVPGAVMHAIARMAERGVLKPFSTHRALCRFEDRREPLVRANLAAAMAALKVGACRDGLDPRDWLGREQVQPVRLAALRWLQVARQAGKIDAAEVDRYLQRCVVHEPDPRIARACEGPVPADAARAPAGPLEVFAYDRDGRSLLRDRLVAVRFDSGAVFLGYTDANARLGIAHAPGGEAELTDPGSWPLAPRPSAAPEGTSSEQNGEPAGDRDDG